MSDNPTGCENFTRTPNAIFDNYLAAITSLCELKVVMAIVRKTYGWQKEQDSISLSQLEEITGLSRQGVIEGVKKACKRGLVGRKASGQGYVYQLKMPVTCEQPSIKEGETSQRFRPATSQPSALPSQQFGLEVVNDLDQQLVNDLDPQKKGLNKLKENSSMAHDKAITRDYVPEITSEIKPTPLPPKSNPALRPLVAVDDKAATRKELRDLIARPNEQFLNGGANQLIHRLTDTYSGVWITRACQIAAGSNANLNYVGRVLEHWQRHEFECKCGNPNGEKPVSIQNYQRSPQPDLHEAEKRAWMEKKYAKMIAQGQIPVTA
jgi:phage replication O-like protein O